MELTEEIRRVIESNIETEEVYVLDPQNDQTHLQAIVVSKSFENTPLVKRHKLVMGSLKNHFATTLHALALKTYTPQEWEEQRSS